MKNTPRIAGSGHAVVMLRAAAAAMPRSLGDRERIGAMHELMAVAISARMLFDKDDAELLRQLGITTSVGVFRPIDEHLYTSACRAGGTYPAMYERAVGLKPWQCPRRVLDGAVDPGRVAPNIAVLLPPGELPGHEDIPCFDGGEVWWCTSMDSKTMTLCTYAKKELFSRPAPFERKGSPTRRQTVDRARWAALFPKTPQEKTDA